MSKPWLYLLKYDLRHTKTMSELRILISGSTGSKYRSPVPDGCWKAKIQNTGFSKKFVQNLNNNFDIYRGMINFKTPN